MITGIFSAGLCVGQVVASPVFARTYTKGEFESYQFSINLISKAGNVKQDGRFLLKVLSVASDGTADVDFTHLPTQQAADIEGGEQPLALRLRFDAFGMPKSMNQLTQMPVLLFGLSNLNPNRAMREGETAPFSYRFDSMPVRINGKCKYVGPKQKGSWQGNEFSFEFEILLEGKIRGSGHLVNKLGSASGVLESAELKLFEDGKESGSMTIERLKKK